MSIISIDDTGIETIAYDPVVPFPNETYVLQSPDLTKWDVVANGTTGIMTETSGSSGSVVRAFFFSPDNAEWELTIDNGGVITFAPFVAVLMFSPIGNDQFKTAAGAMASGYLLFTYTTHTTTHATTFKNRAHAQAQSNPIVLNSLGFPTDPIFIELNTLYTFVLAPPGSPDPPIAPLYTWNDVQGGATVNRTNITEWITPSIPATVVSANSFSLNGDQRVILSVGRRVKLTDATTLYGTITARTFDGTLTTITLALDSGSLSSSLTSVSLALIQPSSSILPSRKQIGLRTLLSGGLALKTTANFNLLPPGIMFPWPRTTAPPGWLLCDGSSYLRASFADLFAVIGTTFGAVDGSHFNVPDRRGRFGLGLDNMGGSAAGRVTSASVGGINAATLGGVGGEETHLLTINEMAAHTHPATKIGLGGSGVNEGWATSANNNSFNDSGSTGGGLGHSTMPNWEAEPFMIYARI